MDSKFFENLDWRGRRRGRYANCKNSLSDVSIGVVAKKGKIAQLSIIFRNDVDKLISESGRVEFVKNGCVVMFRDGGKEGYKICKYGKGDNSYVRASYMEGDDKLVGDYDLLYEDKFDVYYIDLEEKKE